MKTNHLIKFAALLLLSCAMFGCIKLDLPEMGKNGMIYGTVTDYVTGDPVANVNVRLNPDGETTLTGYDGTFQFNDVPVGNYYLSLSKHGYVDLEDDYEIIVTNGKSVRRDVQISSLSQSFQVIINGGQEADELDFGIDPSLKSLNFVIKNNGSVEIVVDIEKSNDWISLPVHGIRIEPNAGFTVKVEIKRSLLNIGNNVGNIYVSSGTQTKQLEVKAEGVGTPVVTDPVLSNVHPYYFDAQASVTYDGGWQIVDKGFEYVIDDYYDEYNKSCGPGVDNFQAQISDDDFQIMKVRAYATNGVHKAYSRWVFVH